VFVNDAVKVALHQEWLRFRGMEEFAMPATILVGVDGSEHSLSALRWAADRGIERRWLVRIVHALDDAVRRTPYFSPEIVEEAARRVVDDARAVVAGRADGIAIETLVVTGTPVDVLLRSAQDVQMIVLGCRVGGAFGQLLGSISYAVASRAPAPVVVVPETVPADSDGPVVVGVDGSTGCLDALEFGFEFADRTGSPLQVIHAWDVPVVYGWDDEPGKHQRLSRLEKDAGLTISETLAGRREQYPDVDVQERPVRGHPVAALVASTHDAGLLVIGGRGHGELGGVGLGSCARGVLQNAHGPVAVVHAQWRAAG
jgi:nucleotide-binding universal stress UspA family protein